MKVPATVVTGFLGAGKTTLVRHLLENAGGRRIALVINEFGDLGVDGETLRACGLPACREDDIVELSNGCICCTVADDFVPAMERLLDRPDPPDHIVIETSGLALPQPLIRAFAWPGVASRLTVDGVVTVVDGAALGEGRFAWDEGAVAGQRAADDALDHDRPIAELFEDQVACADLIVVNKADLLDDPAAAVAQVRAGARPGVAVLTATKGRLPLDVLMGRAAAAEGDMEARRAPHHEAEGEEDHDHDEFETFVVEAGEAADVAALKARVRAAVEAHGILRLKGFAAVAGKPLRLAVQAAGPRVEAHFDRPWEGPRRTRLVVIGERGLDRDAIRAALA